MIKITGKLDFIDELEKEIKSSVNQAFSDTSKRLGEELRAKAQETLNSASFDRWDQGFAIDEVSPGTYVLTLSGKIANIVDKGWDTGEISKNIMEGPRAKYNKSAAGGKKDYVDVPIGVDKPNFLDADGLMNQFQRKTVQFSNRDKDNPGVNPQERDIRRLTKDGQKKVQDRLKHIIESRKHVEGPSKFMVIKRVTKDTIWPKSPIPGPNAFTSGQNSPIDEIGTYFEEILEKLL